MGDDVVDFHAQVVVVGAGVAGLTAARTLIDAGYQQVCILEATKNWGGRVSTETYPDGRIIELGANWIHGGSMANPVFNLANQRKLLKRKEEDSLLRLSRKLGFFYTPSGHCIDKEVGDEAFELFFRLEREATDLFKDPSTTPELCLEEWFSQQFEKELDKITEPDKRKDFEDILWGMKNYLKFHSGDELDLSSARLYGSYWDIPGGDIKLPWGYKKVFEEDYDLIRRVDAIHMETEVTEIDWTTEEDKQGRIKVKVNFGRSRDDKAAGIGLITADHVIVTVPLGVLKANMGTMFKPGLPERKVKAIETTGFARVGKIFLEFESSFWARGEEGLKIAWGRNELENLTYPGDWVKSVFGFDEVLCQEGLLVAWIAGEGAEVMETLTDEEVTHTLHDLLKRLTGDELLPKIKSVTRSKWISNPHFRGTYTFPTTKSNFPEDINILAEPLLVKDVPKICFAGEATSAKGWSTVHGARWSGIREAQRLIKLGTLVKRQE